MFVDTFLSLRVQGISLNTLAERYATWIIGGESPKSRRRRQLEGVLPEWKTETVLNSESLVGAHGCRVDIRISDQTLLARFVHRDTRDPAVLWSTIARVKGTGDGEVTIEHGVGRDAPLGERLFPVAAAPRIITGLLDEPGLTVRPRQLNLPLVTLSGDDVRGFVAHELLRDDRDTPVLVVSAELGDGKPLIDPDLLSRRLRGLASVVLLATDRSSFAFTESLDAQGYGREYRCFNGASHLYGPTRNLQEDHRLWLADSLKALSDESRTEALAGLVAGRYAIRNIPNGFFTVIEEHDRDNRRRLAEQIVRRSSSPPPPILSPDYAQALERELSELRLELQRSMAREGEYLNSWNAADDESRAASRQQELLESQLEQERAYSAEIRDQMGRMKHAKEALAPEQVRAFTNLLSGCPTPEDCLLALGSIFAERIAVLDSAFGAARKSSSFKHSQRLAELFVMLATDYYEGMMAGQGDAKAAAVIGESFAARESETTMSNQTAKNERTFRYAGTERVMWRHLRIGVKDSVSESIRVHFDWDSREKKIIIGWCGEHRYIVG